MSWKSRATTLAVVASLAVGGGAAGSLTRGESRSDRARPLQESHPQPESVLLTAARVQAASLALSVENKTRRDVYRQRQIDLFMLVYVSNLKVAAAELSRRAQAERQRHMESEGVRSSPGTSSRHRGNQSRRGGSSLAASSGSVGGRGTCVLNGHLYYLDCRRLNRESGGSYTADNPHSSAYGAYQIMGMPPGTPPAEQDRIAQTMASCNWDPPNYCGG